MTLTILTNRVTHAGNDALVTFAYPFKVFAEDVLRLTLVTDATGAEVTLVKTTDYSVAGVEAETGGTVTLVVAPATGETLVIERIPPITQTSDIGNSNSFQQQVHEDRFDIITMIMQAFDMYLSIADPTQARALLLKIGSVQGTGAFDALSNRISNVDDPVAAQDAVTLSYHQANLGGGDGTVPVFTNAAFPAPSVTWDGKFAREHDSGGPTSLKVCMESAVDDTYQWVTIATTFG